MPVPHCETTTFSTDYIYELYKSNKLIKPRFQRRKRWLEKDTFNKGVTNNYDFIKFLIKSRVNVIPVLLMKNIDNNKETYSVFDGNNRINAIIDYINRPLYYFDSLIDKEFPEYIRNALLSSPLIKLVSSESIHFDNFCIENGLCSNEVEYHDLGLSKFSKKYIHIYDELRKQRFTDIKVAVAVYTDHTVDEIEDIFKNVNRSGIQLTQQEILACTTSSIMFSANDIEMFSTLSRYLQEFYSDMNTSEALCVDITQHTETMSLYELLISFQMYLSDNFDFIDKPGDSVDQDVIFKCYAAIVDDKFRQKHSNTAFFLTKMILCCQKFKQLCHHLYNPWIDHYAFKQQNIAALSKSKLVTYLLYIYNTKDNDVKQRDNDIIKTLLYNEFIWILSKCKSLDLEEKKH